MLRFIALRSGRKQDGREKSLGDGRPGEEDDDDYGNDKVSRIRAGPG